ncbi:hypothetical protein [Nocardiopsis sp. LOL_012]|uniref:hypothetical protein n=1 Tax=Nocardiopsis sp. LOL_012 TaxID=3345409 RepID=UPI003A8403E9
MGRHTEMDKDAAARIQSVADRDPQSDTAQSGFDTRAQSAADRHADEQDEEDDGEACAAAFAPGANAAAGPGAAG